MTNNNPDSSEYFALELNELERLSNGVLDLIRAGRLDDADKVCCVLKRLQANQEH